MTTASTTALPGLVTGLFERTRRKRSLAALCWVLAIGGHAAAGTWAIHQDRPRDRWEPPLEVELLAETRAEPEPEPQLPEPEPAEPEPSARASAPPKPSDAPPPAARAGALMTAREDAPAAQAPPQPLDFVSDPRGQVYGAGVVAIGGTAAFGKAGARAVAPTPARPAPAAAPKPQGSGLVAASDLSRHPKLNEADPCRGFFPTSALDDSATASVHVVIGKDGRVRSASVVSESPRGQGFGGAARSCMQSKHFVPALDRSGNAAATALRVTVRFNR